MTVTSVVTEPTAGTLTLTATFPAPVERVWRVWADPRQLERWWGPPTYPATIVEHDLTRDGIVTYSMTSPEGERFHGWWRIVEVDPPRGLYLVDGFGESPESATDLPTSKMTLTLEPGPGGGTLMTLVGAFDSPAAFALVMAMGMEEGLKLAVGQIDDLLA